MATRSDIKVVCGSDQLCACLKAGIEGAVHATSDLYDANMDSLDGWGVLLVDASNAYHSLNRITMLKQGNDYHWCYFRLHVSHKAAKSKAKFISQLRGDSQPAVCL